MMVRTKRVSYDTKPGGTAGSDYSVLSQQIEAETGFFCALVMRKTSQGAVCVQTKAQNFKLA